jgi:hypothetical protein
MTDVYLNNIAYETSGSTSQRTQYVSIVKTNRLMLSERYFTVTSHLEHINTPYGKMWGFLMLQ